MNAFVGECRFLKVFFVIVFFAFAKANSQSEAPAAASASIIITKNTTREELISVFKTLREEHLIDGHLTAFKRNSDRINKLGLTLTDNTNEVFTYQTDASTGIQEICIKLMAGGRVSFLGLCNSTPVVKTAAVTKISSSKDEVILSSIATERPNVREQQLEVLRAKAEIRDEERQVSKLESELARRASNVAVLEDRQDDIVSTTGYLKQQQQVAREELKQLEKETNEVKRERKKLDYNNERALAKRDSLRDQQLRLQQQLEQEQKQLEATIQAQKVARELIAQQQQVIAEQGLKAETAESLKAYRTALLGKEGNEVLKKKGFLFFAAEQCSYQIYQGYTIIYDALGKILFTINRELSRSPMSGELNINGKRYTYLYQANSLMVKNQVGQVVNQYGELLYPSQEPERELEFHKTHEFTIEASSSPRELLAIFMDIGTFNFEANILQETRNAQGVLIELIFILQGDEFVIEKSAGIPTVRIELDQPQLLSKVVKTEEG